MKAISYIFLFLALTLLVSSFLLKLGTTDINFHDTYFIFDQAFLLRLASFILTLVALILLAINQLNYLKTNK